MLLPILFSKRRNNANGSTLMTLKAKNYIKKAEKATEEKHGQYKKFKKSIPSSGALLEKK